MRVYCDRIATMLQEFLVESGRLIGDETARLKAYQNINFETSGQNPRAYEVILFLIEPALVLSRLKVEGQIPNGSVFLASTHTNWRDPIILGLLPIIASAKGHPRTIRMLGRASLLDPDIQDSEEARRRRSESDIFNSQDKGFFGRAIFEFRQTFAMIAANFDLIPVSLGGSDPQSRKINSAAMEEVDKELEMGNVVGIFPQGTRDRLGNLHNMKPGLSLMVKKRPDVPIVPISIEGAEGKMFNLFSYFRQITVRIGEPFTYQELAAEFEGLSRKEADHKFLDILGEKIAELTGKPKKREGWDFSNALMVDFRLRSSHIRELLSRNPNIFPCRELLEISPAVDPSEAWDWLQAFDKVEFRPNDRPNRGIFARVLDRIWPFV